MREGVMTETDTCRGFVTPRLVEADGATAAHWNRAEAEVMRLLGEIEALVSEAQT